MCLYPKLIKNRKYTATKKNKGIIPELKDKRAEYVPIRLNNGSLTLHNLKFTLA